MPKPTTPSKPMIPAAVAGEAGEHIATSEYYLGIAVGWEEAAAFLRQRAGEYFARGGSDKEAMLLRDLAKTLDTKAQALRAEYTTKYEPIRRAAFERLEGKEK